MSLENEIKALREAIITLTETLGAKTVVDALEKTVVGVEPKAEAKVEPKAEPKPKTEPKPKVEPKAEPKVEPKVEPKDEAKAEPVVELTHASVQELCVQLSRKGVPASQIKQAVKDLGAEKVAGVASKHLADLKDALDALATKHEVSL